MNIRWDLIAADRDTLRPTLDELTRDFGATFDLEHMGGGCTAVTATLEGGLLVLLTDPGDPQATYTPRWLAGVYDANDFGDPLAMAEDDNAADAVRAALDELAEVRR